MGFGTGSAILRIKRSIVNRGLHRSSINPTLGLPRVACLSKAISCTLVSNSLASMLSCGIRNPRNHWENNSWQVRLPFRYLNLPPKGLSLPVNPNGMMDAQSRRKAYFFATWVVAWDASDDVAFDREGHAGQGCGLKTPRRLLRLSIPHRQKMSST